MIMKTITKVKKDIATAISEITTGQFKNQTEEKKLRDRVTFLRKVVMYLEGKPNEKFVKAEVDRIEKAVKVVEGRFFLKNEENLLKTDVTKARNRHNSKYKVKGMKRHLETLSYLIN